MSKSNQNAIIYRGKSMIDPDQNIVVVAIAKSGNRKTGNMVQTYILNDNGKNPLENSKSGDDFAICGNCPHRGEALTPAHPDFGKYKQAKGRTCYVLLGQGVLIVWKSLQRGIYPTATGDQATAIGRGRMVRLGTYGDPAAVPFFVWQDLLAEAQGHTGYSHQSDIASADFRPDFTMVSADTASQAIDQWALGNRTFRVIGNVSDVIKGKEILCPASEEAGRKASCESCKLCSGNQIAAKSIAIVAHGAAGKSLHTVAA